MTELTTISIQIRYSMLTYREHLEAVRGVEEHRYFDELKRRMAMCKFTIHQIGTLLLCFLSHDDEAIWRVKQALKQEFDDFSFHTFTNWFSTNAPKERHWARWMEN